MHYYVEGEDLVGGLPHRSANGFEAHDSEGAARAFSAQHPTAATIWVWADSRNDAAVARHERAAGAPLAAFAVDGGALRSIDPSSAPTAFTHGHPSARTAP